MKSIRPLLIVRPLLIAAFAVSCSTSGVVYAQTAPQTLAENAIAPVPSRIATVPPKTAPAPRFFQTPQQQRDTADATAASALREERPVVPQLNISLGRSNTPSVILPTANAQALRRNGIDDNVAQCEAQADAQERITCRERLARSSATGGSGTTGARRVDQAAVRSGR